MIIDTQYIVPGKLPVVTVFYTEYVSALLIVYHLQEKRETMLLNWPIAFQRRASGDVCTASNHGRVLYNGSDAAFWFLYHLFLIECVLRSGGCHSFSMNGIHIQNSCNLKVDKGMETFAFSTLDCLQ